MGELGLHMKYTADGPVPVMTQGEELTYLPVPTVRLKELPEGFTDEHREVMLLLQDLVVQVKARNRQIPVTRFEFFCYKPPSGLVKDLEEWKFIKFETIAVNDETTGKPTGSRAIVYMLPTGHAYMKEKVNGGSNNE